MLIIEIHDMHEDTHDLLISEVVIRKKNPTLSVSYIHQDNMKVMQTMA